MIKSDTVDTTSKLYLKSNRLTTLSYAIRGPIFDKAHEMQLAGAGVGEADAHPRSQKGLHQGFCAVHGSSSPSGSLDLRAASRPWRRLDSRF